MRVVLIEIMQAEAQKRIFDRLRKHYGVGSVALGRLFDISRASMYRYEHGQLVLPMETGIRIEKVSRGVVQRHEIFPAMFSGYVREDGE
ncbi:hypothetical protein BIY22_15990 [Vibrio panuliri]|uniref:Uncharacterized protein n=1 Tax=Vibrio panuliri TaxID=1381081 RepID=A0A1Q9HNC7_9VIBR|nr:hypothetical protein BIY22_15990 [Vibrio panuliri]